MNNSIFIFLLLNLFLTTPVIAVDKNHKKIEKNSGNNLNGFTDAEDFGFSPNATGINNAKALQAAADKGGTIIISKTATYKIAATVFIGDSTSLIFGNKVIIEKSAENGRFTHVFLNKGARTRTYNYNIP